MSANGKSTSTYPFTSKRKLDKNKWELNSFFTFTPQAQFLFMDLTTTANKFTAIANEISAAIFFIFVERKKDDKATGSIEGVIHNESKIFRFFLACSTDVL